MLRYIRIITINIITFLGLLIIVNFCCGILLKKRTEGNRYDLPNYKNNLVSAKEIFFDYNQIKHQYEPFVGWKTLPYNGKTLTINNRGNRVHEAPSFSGPKKSIFFFGGSTMWGEGSDDQNTIPALVNKNRPDLDVSNHAQLAYASRQELDALITLYSQDKKPDYVVFYDGVNESAFLCPKEISELPAHRLVPMFRSKLYQTKREYLVDLLGKVFYENTQKALFSYTYKPDINNSPYDCKSNPAKAREIAEIMVRNWELAHSMVEKEGGKFFAVLQPAALIGNPRIDHLKIDMRLKPEFESVYSEIRKIMSEKKYTWFFDLSSSFDSEEYIYIDFCHVSANGNEIIAKHISSFIP